MRRRDVETSILRLTDRIVEESGQTHVPGVLEMKLDVLALESIRFTMLSQSTGELGHALDELVGRLQQ